MELERVINVRLLFVCNDYVDYECDRFIGQSKATQKQHRFAKIDKKDFPKFMEAGQEHDRYELLMDTLKTAIEGDAKLNFVVEKREIEMRHVNPKDESPKKTQKIDFITKVEYTWCGEGE